MKKNFSDDRRRFIRINKNGKIKFQKINTAKLEDTNLKKAQEGYYKNISPYGLMFESNEELEPGDILKLYLYMKDWMKYFPKEKEYLSVKLEGKPIKFIGNVVYCEAKGNGKYQVGVEFTTDQYDETAKKLMEIIEKELS